MLEYNRMVDVVEEKYGVDIRDYAGTFGSVKSGDAGHFDIYCRVANDPMPFGDGVYPDVSGLNHGFAEKWTVTRDGVFRAATEEEYDADFKLIHEQYERYNKWVVDNPSPPYLDYWHWAIENAFMEVSNGCDREWCMQEIVEDESNPDWVRNITQLFINEYKDELTDGSVEVHIMW